MTPLLERALNPLLFAGMACVLASCGGTPVAAPSAPVSATVASVVSSVRNPTATSAPPSALAPTVTNAPSTAAPTPIPGPTFPAPTVAPSLPASTSTRAVNVSTGQTPGAPQLAYAPGSVTFNPQQSLLFAGSGFGPNESLTIVIEGPNDTRRSIPLIIDPDGTVSGRIFPRVLPGEYRLTVTRDSDASVVLIGKLTVT